MGREIRMVPPGWEHPMKDHYDPFRREMRRDYRPLYDESCEEAWAKWRKEFQAWLGGGFAQALEKYGEDGTLKKGQPYTSFCRWEGGPPDPEYYRPQWDKSEATWIQVYETVSEGTPVTPPFATPEELIDYLVKNGDFWDQAGRKEGTSLMPCDPWRRDVAEKFVKSGWAPSIVVHNGQVKSGVEGIHGTDKANS